MGEFSAENGSRSQCLAKTFSAKKCSKTQKKKKNQPKPKTCQQIVIWGLFLKKKKPSMGEHILQAATLYMHPQRISSLCRLRGRCGEAQLLGKPCISTFLVFNTHGAFPEPPPRPQRDPFLPSSATLADPKRGASPRCFCLFPARIRVLSPSSSHSKLTKCYFLTFSRVLGFAESERFQTAAQKTCLEKQSYNSSQLASPVLPRGFGYL